MAFALAVLILGVVVDLFGPHGLSNALAGLMATLVTVFCVSNVVAGIQGAKIDAAKAATAAAATSLTTDTEIASKLHEVRELVTTVGQAVSTTNKVLTAALSAAKPGA